MDRLADFDAMFVRIMLSIIIALLVNAVFPLTFFAAGASADFIRWRSLEPWQQSAFILLTLFMIKYMHTLAVFRYHEKRASDRDGDVFALCFGDNEPVRSDGQTSACAFREYVEYKCATDEMRGDAVDSSAANLPADAEAVKVRARKLKVRRAKFLMELVNWISRVVFLGSLYLLVYALFGGSPRATSFQRLYASPNVKLLLFLLMSSAFLLPNYFSTRYAILNTSTAAWRPALKVFFREWRFVLPTTLLDVQLAWLFTNLLNVLILLAILASRMHTHLTLERAILLFLAFNTIVDYFLNAYLFFADRTFTRFGREADQRAFGMTRKEMTMRRQFYGAFTVAAAAAILGLTLASGCTEARKTQPEKVTVRLKWTYSAGFGGLIAAKEQRFFPEHIDVTLMPGGATIDPVLLVASGQNDFGMAGADRLLQAREKGIPVVAIALENRKSFVAFTSLAELDITKPQHFEGRIVGTQSDDTFTVYQALITKNNVDRTKITEVPVGWDLAPLMEKKIHVYPSYVINQPVILRERNVAINVVRPEQFGVDFAGVAYFTTERTLRERPEIVQAFVTGLVKGWQYTLEHPGEVADVAVRTDPSLKRAEEVRLLSAVVDELKKQSANRQLLSISKEDLVQTQAIMLEQRLLSKPVDLGELVAPQFVQAAHREIGAQR